MNDLFGNRVIDPLRGRRFLEVLPTSVIDVQSDQQRRITGGHDNQSSRSQFSNFPVEVADLVYELYLDKYESVYDPFAGWGERGARAKLHDKKYCGIDINDVAIKYAKETYGVENEKANSLWYNPSSFDAVFTCPPYWNLEHYSDVGLENVPSWREFVSLLENIFLGLSNLAPAGAKFCIVVGDWRADKVFYDFSYQVQRIFDRLGLVPVDKVILSRKNISKIKVMAPQAIENGYTVKVHEYLFVYEKP